MKIAGMVLAGGRSRRFGRDKALAMLNGALLIHWSLEALRSGSDILGINGPPALAEALRLPHIADLAGPTTGPLAGVLGGLAWAKMEGCTHLATAPCDTPFLPATLTSSLAAKVGDTPVLAARAEREHPLCALWRVDLFARLQTLATPPQPSMRSLVETVGGRWLDFPDEAAFANLNTEEDLRRAERPHDGAPPDAYKD